MKKINIHYISMHYITQVFKSIGLSNNTPQNKNIKDNFLLSKPQYYKNISHSMVISPKK